MKIRQWAALALFSFGLSTLAWGEMLPMGKVDGLDLKIEFSDDVSVAPNGDILFRKASGIAYKVLLTNSSNLTYEKIEAQASIHSVGARCDETTLADGELIPGSGLSPIHNFKLSPGEEYDMESRHVIPPTLCSTRAQIRTRVVYVSKGRMVAKSVACPVYIQLQ